MKDDKGDLVADSQSILARWRNYFSQILNVHRVHDVRQTEIQTAEPIVPESSASEVEMAIEKLKSYKSPCIDQIPAELNKAGGKKICCEIHKLFISIWNKENCLRSGRSRSLYLSIRKAIKQVTIIGEYQFANYIQNFTQHPALKVTSIHRGNYWGPPVWILMQQVNY